MIESWGDTRIEDGLAVVTGAGSGLGQALAENLARHGMRVAGLGRRASALAETAERIGVERFLPLEADVADADAVAAAFARLDAEDRPVTLLINNAAIYERFDILEAPPGRYMHHVAVNLGGMVNCTHAALERMTETGLGRIVNVTTFADLAPLPGSGAYSVSKGAARIFTRALVADIADRFPGIVISDWIPGALKTGMGIPDGISPADAAVWGAALALWHDPTLTGAVFDRDRELMAPRSWKRRMKDWVLRRPAPDARHLPPNGGT